MQDSQAAESRLGAQEADCSAPHHESLRDCVAMDLHGAELAESRQDLCTAANRHYRDARYDPALASRDDRRQVGLQQAAQKRRASPCLPRSRRPRARHGPGKSVLRLKPHPGRLGKPRRRGLHATVGSILKQSGTESVRLPPRSPDLSPHIERFMLSVQGECLHRMVLFGEHSLRNAVRDFLAHYHKERNNQGLDNRLIEPDEEVGRTTGEIACRKRLGGMLRYYYRKVA